ncbi:MAG: transposase [Phycisphaeraceae bacterium]
MNEHHEQPADHQPDEASSGPRRQRRDASQWRALIEQHRDSGLSVRAFCQQHSLNEASFYAWRRRLRDQASPTPDASARFVRLQPRDRGEAGIIEVRFAGGTILKCSSDHLAALVRLLKGDVGETGSC